MAIGNCEKRTLYRACVCKNRSKMGQTDAIFTQSHKLRLDGRAKREVADTEEGRSRQNPLGTENSR
jgi:hypothetical protein